ncbi:hypothetical protein HYALB_00011763 [Hymenoscyphus albidus]|uniref:Uncharacterized protein n=1 Tax=Hymenoscyphus albidus TaxID=595503 RepID=A0A9N9LW95_9HELO|nr:hypothetical protein HYALB_00011763 [Hymenoscyphus albidus]
MTKKNDILPAISGLAREIAQQSGYTYAAGIWIEEIRRGLAWHSSCSATAKESDEHHAPSWSWAFWPTSPGIEFMMRPGALYADMDEGKATLIRYKIIPEDDDKFGRVKSGYIDLRGRGISMRSWLEQNHLIFNYISEETFLFSIFTEDDDSTIYTYALLLVQVENSPKETYRRVGLITFWPREGYSMDTWDKKEVHII